MKIDPSIRLTLFVAVFTIAPLLSLLIYKLTHDLKRLNTWIRGICYSVTITGALCLLTGFKTISYEFNQIYFCLFYLTSWVLVIHLSYQIRFMNKIIPKLISLTSIVLSGIIGVTFFIPSLLFINSIPQKYYKVTENRRIEVFPQGAPLHPAGIIIKTYNKFGPFMFQIEKSYFKNYEEFESKLKKEKK